MQDIWDSARILYHIILSYEWITEVCDLIYCWLNYCIYCQRAQCSRCWFVVLHFKHKGRPSSYRSETHIKQTVLTVVKRHKNTTRFWFHSKSYENKEKTTNSLSYKCSLILSLDKHILLPCMDSVLWQDVFTTQVDAFVFIHVHICVYPPVIFGDGSWTEDGSPPDIF